MAFNSTKLIVRIYFDDGKFKDVYCETLEQARVVLSFNCGHSEIVGNYE